MNQLSDGEPIASIWYQAIGSGRFSMLVEFHSDRFGDVYRMPLSGSTLRSTWQRVANRTLPPYYVQDWENWHIIGGISATGSGVSTSKGPKGTLHILPVRVTADTYHATGAMCRWLGFPEIVSGVYTGMLRSRYDDIPVRI
jgi:hypothetical protein